MNLQEIRQKYPQYDDLSDEQVIAALHSRFYSDLPFDEVARKVGYQSPSQEPIDTTTGLRNLPLRIKLSFIDDPVKRETLLKSIYPETRRLPDNRLVFKNPETKRWTTVDEEARGIRDLADWAGMIPEVVGGTLGVVAGAPVPIPGARIAGAAAGTIGGRAVKEVIGGAISGKIPARLSKKDMAVAGVTGAIGEAGGALAVKALSPFAKKVPKATQNAMQYLKQYGGRLTPAQATETRILDLLENVAESSIAGGGRLRQFFLKQEKILENIASDIVERFGIKATPEEAGLLVQKAITGKRIAFNAAGRALYRNVDKLTEGVQVSTVELKKEAGKMLVRLTPKVGKKIMMPSLRNKTTVRMLKDFTSLPDEVPFSYLQQWRSDLLQIGYAPTDLIPGKTAGMAKHLAREVDKTFKNAEGGLSGDALNALERANTFWRAGKEKFNSKLIKSLSTQNPEAITKSVFKPGAIQSIRKTRQIIGSKTWEKLKGTYISKLMFKDALDTKGIVNGLKLDTALRNMGQTTIDEIFTKTEQAELRNFVNVLKAIQVRPPALGGGMLIQLTQAGAILDMAAFRGPSVGSATVLLAPPVMAQLFTRPGGIRWLTKGLVTKPGTKEAMKLATRIMALTAKEKMQLQNTD